MRRSSKRSSALLRNPPFDRLSHIIKLYGEKQPWVVLDTLSVIFETIGIDNAERELEAELDHQGQDVWGADLNRMRSRVRAMFGSHGKLHTGLPRYAATGALADVPFRSQVRYWWFGDPEVDKLLEQPHQRQASTLSEKLAVILELSESPTFAEGAMRAPSEADGIFPWVARELSKLSKQTINEIDETGPTLTAGAEYEFYVAKFTTLRRSGNLIAQWAKANRVDLMKMSLHEVIEASKGYRVKKKVERGEIVYRFKSGWTVESLKGKRQLDCEAGFLSHCVYSYKEAVDCGDSEIYSLRDPDGVPYVTMEWETRTLKPGESRPTDPLGWPGHFTQIFGKANSEIGSKEFSDYVFEVGQDNKPPLTWDDVPEVVELIRLMVIEFIDKVKGGDVMGVLLVGGPLKGRSLVGMKLAHAELAGRDMSGADLRGATLHRADLSDTLLIGTDLSDADLSEANLTGADLSNADLHGADLTYAKLYSTNLRTARSVTEANIQDVACDRRTRWPDAIETYMKARHKCEEVPDDE